MTRNIDVQAYTTALTTWAQAASRPEEERSALQAGGEHLQARYSGIASTKVLCAALGAFLLQTRGGAKTVQDITKSCLLDRMIYGGEPLRTTPCPIHRGHWSGCRPERCPAGCSWGYNITGWLPVAGSDAVQS